ncbi:MAG: epoxyqueuosine reductase QueH [Deltaproteobacteria bacterium]|nr:epoxyqueuosine reductase QueH [Deltaproteobacteria bacterium]
MNDDLPIREKILIHVCCGPCSIHPLERLLSDGHEVTALWYNPNVHPLREYLRRREGAVQVAERFGIRIICLDDEARPETFLREVAFREASRCLLCHRLRLEKTIQIARRGRFEAFTTSLLYSRQQRHDQIRELARDIAGSGRLRFHYEDYRTGWQRGIKQSLAWGIYRQDYCGCIYSEFERFQGDMKSLSRV